MGGRGEIYSFSFRSNFRGLRVYKKFSTFSRIPSPSLLSPALLAEFSTHTRRKRTRKMFAHALDRPVCHGGDSLHPSTPSFPNVSHPPQLSSTITPSPLCLRSLSFARTRAGVVFLPSFSPLTVIPLPGSL